MCETEIRHMVCCSQMSKGACVWTKRKSPQTLPLIPMKSSTVWHGHSIRPSLPAETARKGKENLLHGRRSRLITPPAKKNRAFPTGNALLYISLSSVALIASFTSSAILNNLFAICNSRLLPTNQIVNYAGRVRPIQGRTLFLFCI